MKNSFEVVKLGDLCSFENGDRGKNYPGSKAFVEAGVPFINAGHLYQGSIDMDRMNYIHRDRYNLLNSGKIRIGDLLFCLRGSLGKYAMVEELQEGAIASSLIIVRPGAKLNRRFLAKYFESTLCEKMIKKHTTGAAQPNLSANNLKSFEIPLPTLTEQKRIAAILDKTDVLRRKRQVAIKLANDFLRAIFLDMFGDPVTNPKGWEQHRLGSICDVRSSRRVFVTELVEAGIPFYRGTEVGQLGNGQFVEPSLFITKEHYEILKAQSGVPRRGDLLLPSICPDGRIYLVENDEPFYFKDGRVLWIKVDGSRINSTFLKNHLKQLFFAGYSKIASGTTFAELKIFALKDLTIHVPPVDLQGRFGTIVGSIEQQKTRLCKCMEGLDTLFASLTQHAFRGEL